MDAPILRNPAERGRAIALTFEQFTCSWANNLPEPVARNLYDTYHVAASGVPLFQDVLANLNPFTETKVDVGNPDRGPMLNIAREKDNTIPPAISTASYRHQPRSPGVTEYLEIPRRGHSSPSTQAGPTWPEPPWASSSETSDHQVKRWIRATAVRYAYHHRRNAGDIKCPARTGSRIG